MTSPDRGSSAWFRAQFERISVWMTAHGAPLIVENLAPGATTDELDGCESVVPPQLRALWSIHNGQHDDGNGFIEAYNLLSLDGSMAQRESVELSLDYEREHPTPNAAYTKDELASDAWIPFAGQDSDSLVVHGVSGRVFECLHDDPEPKLLAPSLADWMEGYAQRVEADDYAVEEGFGDYYLQLRDRAQEQRQADKAQRAAEKDRYRRDTPLIDQFMTAYEKRDTDRCLEVVQDALERDDKAVRDVAIEYLFVAHPEPQFAAAVLRPSLSALTLTPDQWLDVAVGGALLENNAIRAYATTRASDASDARIGQLGGGDTKQKAALDRVLKDLGRTPAKSGGWLSRLFGKDKPKN